MTNFGHKSERVQRVLILVGNLVVYGFVGCVGMASLARELALTVKTVTLAPGLHNLGR